MTIPSEGEFEMAPATRKGISKKKFGVLTLMTSIEDAPDVAVEDREYEWFNTEDAMSAHFDQVVAGMAEDVRNYGDIAYATAEIIDTKAIIFGRIAVQAKIGSGVQKAKWERAIRKNPDRFLIAPENTEDAPVVKVRPKRKATDVEAVKPVVGGAKARAAVRKAKPRKATDADAPKPNMPKPKKTEGKNA